MLRDYKFIRSVLLPDEKVVFATTLHWICYLQGLLLTLLGLSLSLGGHMLLVALLPPPWAAQLARPLAFGALGLSCVGCILLFSAGLRQSGTELVVTNRRVVSKSGVMSRSTAELFLAKIEGADIEQSAWGRMLGFGSIVIRGVGTNLLPIYDIDSPEKFQKAVLSQMQRGSGG